MYIHIPKTSGTNFRSNVINTYSESNYSNYSNEPPFGNLDDNKLDEFKKISKKDLNDEFNQFLLIATTFNQKNIQIKPQYCEFYNKIHFISKSKISINHSHNIKHFPLNLWEKYSIYDNHRVFSIVRNPYTRFISYYTNIVHGLKKYFNFDISIKEFIKNDYMNLITDNCKFMNYKLNQVDYLKNNSSEIICTKFYKMESDLEQLSYDFNLPNLIKEKINYGLYNRNYSELFDNELIEWVQNTYENDFKYFSYDMNPFWQ
jgi:hypothetical protein